ncbi:restriction endonuclease subunit S [bacterium]|nr:restriction endonuclease subunit S [bacterium]
MSDFIKTSWKEVSISDLISDITTGVSVNSENRERGANEVGILKTSCISRGQFFLEEHKAVLTEEVERVKTPLKADSILMSRMNTPNLVGEVGYVQHSHPDIYLPDRLWMFRGKDGKADTLFLTQLFSSTEFRQRLGDIATGTSGSMKNIPQKSFLQIPVQLPPLPEQEKIAEILSGMDELILRNEMLLVKNQQLMKAVLSAMLEKLEKGFKHSEKMIEEIFREISIPEAHNSATPLYSLTIESGLVPKPERYIRDFLLTDKDKDNYKQICKGDFVMNPMNLRWGAISTFRETSAVKVSKYYTTFRALESLTSSNLYEFLFRSDRNLCLYERIATGSLIEKMRVHWSAFKKLKVPFPPFEEQQKFDDISSSFELKITRMKILIEKQKAFRSALSSDLLSGRKRVRI